MANRGDERSAVVIVGDAPAKIELEQGRCFVGTSGRLLDWCLSRSGLAAWDPWLTNAVKCSAPTATTPAQVKSCAPEFLHKEIGAYPRRLVVAMGGSAALAIRGVATKVLDRVGMVEWDERWGGVHVLYTVHPSNILYNPNFLGVFLATLQTATRILSGTHNYADPPRTYCPEDPGEALATLVAMRRADLVAVDTETSSLDWYSGNLLGVGLSASPDAGYWFPWSTIKADPRVFEALRDLLGDPNVQKVGHQIKFDCHWLERWVGPVRGQIHDTIIASQLADENLPLKLEQQCALRLGAEPWDAAIKPYKSKMETCPPDLLAKYAALDPAWTRRLWGVVGPSVVDLPAYQVMQGARVILGQAESVGMLIHQPTLDRIGDLCTEQAVSYRQRLQDEVMDAQFNPNSNPQVGEYLFGVLGLEPPKLSEKTGDPSTDDESLEQLDLKYPNHEEYRVFRTLLKLYRKASKLNSTYVEGFRRRIRSDGAINCDYNLTGTVTGRISSTDPNMQNIPKCVRPMFVARPGHVFVDFDYSQIEVRIWAAFSQDEVLLDLFRRCDADQLVYEAQLEQWTAWRDQVQQATWVDPSGLPEDSPLRAAVLSQFGWRDKPTKPNDVHRMVASIALGKRPEDVTETERTAAKRIVFGAIYGKHFDSFVEEFGLEVATRIHQAIFGTFARAAAWLEETKALLKTSPYEVGSPFGKVRRFPTLQFTQDPKMRMRHMTEAALREGVNAPIQGTASYINLYQMGRAAAELKRRGLAGQMLVTVHDSQTWEVPQEIAVEAQGVIRATLQLPVNLPGLDVPLRVDTDITKHWTGALNESDIRKFLCTADDPAN